MDIKSQLITPPLEEKQILNYLKSYRKISYNRFRWWREWDIKPPLKNKSPLLDKIQNGDYEVNVYKLQAWLNDWKLKVVERFAQGDVLKFNEHAKILRARKQKLWEDYNKQEPQRLEKIAHDFAKFFKTTEDKVWKLMETFDGTTEQLYFHCEKEFHVSKTPLFKALFN